MVLCSDFQDTFADVDLSPCSPFIDHMSNFLPSDRITETFREK